MSNIAVNTFAMKAVVIGTGNLEDVQQFAGSGRASRSWASLSWLSPSRPEHERARWQAIGEIRGRVPAGRSGAAANTRRPRVASRAVLARV